MALYHFTLKSDRKPNGTKIMANEHAEYNGREGKYEKLDEKRNSIASSDHIAYIHRDASFTVREGCLYKAHHLPEWANNSPKTFFAYADAYEESEHTYKEIEFALQNELTLEQNLEIINSFVSKNFSDYYWAYAVHDKAASLGNGERNLHCHFMFSPRQLDELEKEQERKPECFFKKARRIYTKIDGTIIDNRREGGCKIPPVWNKVGPSIVHLKYLRKDFEETTNHVLQKYGHVVSIDCRSHEARCQEAVQNGNQLEAELFSLPPETHLGPAAIHNPDDPRVIALKDLRKLRYETQRMIEALNRLERLSADQSLMEKQIQLNIAAQKIDENTSDIPIKEEEMALLEKNIAAAALETTATFTKVISFADTMRQAKSAMMMPEETALRLFSENQSERDAFQKSATAELTLLKQKMRATGAQIAALQTDVILYRQAMEEAKEMYLANLKTRAEIRLPVLEKEIAATKEQIAVKGNDDDSNVRSVSKETPSPLTAQVAGKVLEREKLLREKEMLAIFQQHKVVSQEIFELKRSLRQINLQEKKTKNGPARRELQLQKENLVQTLKTAGEAKSNHSQMQAIRKMFGEKEIKPTLTHMANKITLGNVPRRKEIEVLQEKQTVTVERIRALMAARIRTMTDTAIGERLTEKNNANTLVKQKNKAERRYTAMEVRRTIYDVLAAIREEKRTLDKTLDPLEARYISEARAKKMAIDLYTQNQTKELRELKRLIEEKSEHLRKCENTLLAKEYAFLHTPKLKWFDQLLGSAAVRQYEADKKEIQVLKASVAAEKKALDSLQDKVTKTEVEINAVLKSPEADVKIEQITQGILKKNQPVAEQIFSLRAQKDSLMRQEKEFTVLANAATRQIEADRGRNIFYAPSKGIEKSKIDIVSMIARAFSGNDAACAAVARIKDDSSMLDWEAKDAAERKAQQREAAWSRGEF